MNRKKVALVVTGGICLATWLAVAVGFEKDKVVQMFAPSAFAAAEAKRTHTFQGGDFGGGGQWFAFGAWR